MHGALLVMFLFVDGSYLYSYREPGWYWIDSGDKYVIVLRKDVILFQNDRCIVSGVGAKDKFGNFPVVWFSGDFVVGYGLYRIENRRTVVGYSSFEYIGKRTREEKYELQR